MIKLSVLQDILTLNVYAPNNGASKYTRKKHIELLGVFIGRTDVEAETPILWPPDVKS